LDAGSGPRVLIYHAQCEAYVRLLSSRLSVRDVTGIRLDEEPLDTVDVLLTWTCPDGVLARLTGLKWIQTTSAGMDNVLDFCRSQPQLVVTTTKGLQAEPVAGFVMLMILALHWRLPAFLAYQRERRWMPEYSPAGISQSTCAILGLGHIGQRVAGHAKHLGMSVLGMRRRAVPAANVDAVYPHERLHEMLGLADFVVLALPLTESTRAMFKTTEFKAMKRSAYLVNVARGGIVDQQALADALRAGDIAGAALDVFHEEPLPAGHALWTAPNIIITPHLAGNRADYLDGAAAIFAHNLRVFPDRRRMRGLADIGVGY